MKNKFVVYAHYTLDTNELFYIGEGTVKRSKSSLHRNRFWNFKVNKHGFRTELLYTNLTKNKAETIETRLIKNLKKRGSKIVNICIGPMFKNHWILNIEKEQHPMYGKKNPKASERMIKWNKERVGEKSPVYGLKRPDLSERNKLRQFKSFTKPVICLETGIVYNSALDASEILTGERKPNHISSQIAGRRNKALGFTWAYFTNS